MIYIYILKHVYGKYVYKIWTWAFPPLPDLVCNTFFMVINQGDYIWPITAEMIQWTNCHMERPCVWCVCQITCKNIANELIKCAPTVTSLHKIASRIIALLWRHNERDGVSNHRRLDCLLNRLYRRISNKTSKLCVTGFCEGNPPVTGGFP